MQMNPKTKGGKYQSVDSCNQLQVTDTPVDVQPGMAAALPWQMISEST